jgi:hypothetical protein
VLIIPDQIGFGKSSEPESYQFSFYQLAASTRELLRSLNIDVTPILGHSTLVNPSAWRTGRQRAYRTPLGPSLSTPAAMQPKLGVTRRSFPVPG